MDATLNLIRQFEGYRDTPYWDVNAFRTGYGSDTVTMADGSVVPVTEGMRITREDAERDLARRVQSEFMPRAASAVGSAWDTLSDQQKAALVSITYNYGSLPESVARAVSSGNFDAGAAAIRGLSSHNDGVNAKRRAQEADIFGGAGSIPDYDGGAATGTYAPGTQERTSPTMRQPPKEEPKKPELNFAVAGNDVSNFLRPQGVAQFAPLVYERRNSLGGL